MANEFDICQNNVMAKIILIAINQKNVRVYLQQNIFFIWEVKIAMSFTLSKGLLKFQLIVDLYFQNFYLHFSLKISLIQTGYDSDSAMHMNYVVSL